MVRKRRQEVEAGVGSLGSVGRVGGDGRAGKAGRTGEPGKESPARAYAEFLKPYEPAVRKLADGLRALVRSQVAPCHETIYDAGYTIALHYGAGPRITDAFCYISVHRSHVNLGFQRGSLLSDPQGVLRGDGPWMRHIQVKSTADLDRPELRTFLRAACSEADHEPGQRGKTTVLSVVKRSQARTRRSR